MSLKQLQHTASSLDAEPTVDGLFTAFQQLSLIQKQLQGECRQCKVILFRQQRDRKRAGDAAAAAATEQAQVQLAALNQLRAAADDAQDFLLSLVQQLLQVRFMLLTYANKPLLCLLLTTVFSSHCPQYNAFHFARHNSQD